MIFTPSFEELPVGATLAVTGSLIFLPNQNQVALPSLSLQTIAAVLEAAEKNLGVPWGWVGCRDECATPWPWSHPSAKSLCHQHVVSDRSPALLHCHKKMWRFFSSFLCLSAPSLMIFSSVHTVTFSLSALFHFQSQGFLFVIYLCWLWHLRARGLHLSHSSPAGMIPH